MNQTIDRPPDRRRWWLGLMAVVLVAGGLLAGTGAALSQSSSRFSLGCWAVTTFGGSRGEIQSTNFRVQLAGSWIGGPLAPGGTSQPSSLNFRLRTNHFATRALTPVAGPPFVPPTQGDTEWLPIIFGEIAQLQRLCP
jgi:hypothetical protein